MDDLASRIQSLEQRVEALERLPRGGGIVVPPPPSFRAAAARTEQHRPLESAIGQWWIGIVGIVALFVGVSFFLKYAFDRDLISESVRVGIGLVAGVAFLVAGEYLRPKIKSFSYLMSGGGLGLLYLSCYAAVDFYGLIPHSIGFTAMIVVTAIGVVMATMTRSPELALLSFSGGYISPLLLQSPDPQYGIYFLYLAALTLCLVGLAMWRRWLELPVAGIAWALIHAIVWVNTSYDISVLPLTILGFSAVFLLLQCTHVVFALRSDQPTETTLPWMLFVNAAWCAAAISYVLDLDYPQANGFFLLCLGVVHLGFLYALSFGTQGSVTTRTVVSSLGVFLIAMAAVVHYDGMLVPMLWALGAIAIASVGYAARYVELRLAAYCLVLLGGLFVLFQGDLAHDAFRILTNQRFLAVIGVAAAAAFLGVLAARYRDVLHESERHGAAVSWVVASLVLLVGLTYEIFDYHEQLMRLLLRSLGSTSGEIERLESRQNTAVSVLWACYALVLMGIGIARRRAYVRWLALLLFGLTILKVFTVDLSRLGTVSRIVSFLLLGVLLLVTSFLYARFQHLFTSDDSSTTRSQSQ